MGEGDVAPPKTKRTVKEWFLGGYDYGYLCTPQWPYCAKDGRKRDAPTFFGKDAFLGILTATVMGLQHALAMCGGLITVPFLLGTNAAKDLTLSVTQQTAYQQYLISAALIVCGITTAIQVTGIPLPFNRQLGAGILSVMGVSFTTFAPADSTMKSLMASGNSFEEALGYIFGTAAVCSVVPLFISFLPHKVIKKIFPPIVCGVTIVLIGINLTAVGIKAWGGGAFCADNANGLIVPYSGCATYNATTGVYTNQTDCFKKIPVTCQAGQVKLPYGSPQFLGLGFSVFAMIILIEIFGSPFLRNCGVVIALLFGYMLAGVTRYNGLKYVTSAKIDSAPAITFIWRYTFPLKIYGPLVLPFIVVFVITSIETVGDVAATEEASFLSTTGPVHEKRMRGALLNDGISSLFSALGTSLPLTTFAQNNGVISLTAVASRQAGWACAAWLFLLGVLGKVAGAITTIPDCVVGGMTTFLFANVIASGIKIMVGEHLTRRNRFIMACSLGLGIGVSLVPAWATNALWPCTTCSPALKGLREAVMKILSTGFCLGAIVSMLLNLILPAEAAMVVPENSSKGMMPLTNEPSVKYVSVEKGDVAGPAAEEVITEAPEPMTGMELDVEKAKAV